MKVFFFSSYEYSCRAYNTSVEINNYLHIKRKALRKVHFHAWFRCNTNGDTAYVIETLTVSQYCKIVQN